MPLTWDKMRTALHGLALSVVLTQLSSVTCRSTGPLRSLGVVTRSDRYPGSTDADRAWLWSVPFRDFWSKRAYDDVAPLYGTLMDVNSATKRTSPIYSSMRTELGMRVIFPCSFRRYVPRCRNGGFGPAISYMTSGQRLCICLCPFGYDRPECM